MKGPKRIIGISGKAGSGKDTLAKFLQEILPHIDNIPCYEIVHFADPLKEAVETACMLDTWYTRTQEGKKTELEWLDKMTVREVLQKFGTAIREGVHPDFWVRALMEGTNDWDIIIPDVRFPNEAEEIRKRGGILIRIERKGSGAGDHISETALDDYDKWNMVIFNDYDLYTLKEQAKTIMKCYHDYLYNS